MGRRTKVQLPTANEGHSTLGGGGGGSLGFTRLELMHYNLVLVLDHLCSLKPRASCSVFEPVVVGEYGPLLPIMSRRGQS
jgi:hypothetical protein